jgi:hypothetical protein
MCHPSYVGSIHRRIAVQANLSKNGRPCSKKDLKQKELWYGSRGRASAWQAQGPEFRAKPKHTTRNINEDYIIQLFLVWLFCILVFVSILEREISM